MSILYPPPYKRTVCFYEKGDSELIQRTINEFDWIRALSNISVDKKVCCFIKTLLNIIPNFIPLERIVCNNRDPPWINNKIKNKLQIILPFDRHVHLFGKCKVVQNQLDMSTEKSKQKYYSELSSKLVYPATSL